MAQITCVVVTPEATALEETADFVAVPLYDGELGVAPGHSPLVGRLGYGELRLRSGGKVTRYYVDGGFVQVRGDVVTVLTGRAVAASRIDAATVRNQLAAALERTAATQAAYELRERAVAQARGQLRVAEKA